jgi:RNA polymerase sigma-70 factor (ECF subfamily)
MTWAYRLAHNAAFRQARRAAREQPTGDLPSVAAPGERSRTAPWIRSDVKSTFKRLREQLEPQDRMVLVLRVDRGMSWEDIAQMLVHDAQLTKDELRRATSALRQRFQRVKARLHELARAEGLLRSTV